MRYTTVQAFQATEQRRVSETLQHIPQCALVMGNSSVDTNIAKGTVYESVLRYAWTRNELSTLTSSATQRSMSNAMLIGPHGGPVDASM